MRGTSTVLVTSYESIVTSKSSLKNYFSCDRKDLSINERYLVS